VLLDEVVSAFSGVNGVILDCTLGYAGHSEAILEANPNAQILGLDRDDEAINFSQARLRKFGSRVQIQKSKFSDFPKFTQNLEIKGILADIGISSLQIDKFERGFSLKSPNLDMRMDLNQEKDAKFVINNYSVDDLARILREFGEIKNAKFYADKIAERRKNHPITSAKEFAEIFGAAKQNGRSVNLATLAFQAIRIEVNNELGELEKLLENLEILSPKGAILAIISFHSLEDRVIKRKFREWQRACICPEFALKCECGGNHELGSALTKKPITPTADEIKRNSRSSCAKMRIFRFKD